MLVRTPRPAATMVTIETKLANLENRRRKFAEQRAADAEKLEKARARRSESLGQNGDIEAASTAIRELKNRVGDLDELLADIDLQIAEAADRLATERDLADRNRRADALEKIATAAASRARDVDTAVAALVSAVVALRSELPEDIRLWPRRNATRPVSRDEIVPSILADALSQALPNLFDLSNTDYDQSALSLLVPRARYSDHPTPMSAVEASEQVISAQLRDLAVGIRTGAVGSAALGERAPDQNSSLVRDEEIFVVKSVSYIGDPTRPPLICGHRRVHLLPKPVADLVVSQGLGLRMSSPEGIAALEDEKRLRRDSIVVSGGSSIRFEDCVPLGDPMHLRASPEEIAEVERAIG